MSPRGLRHVIIHPVHRLPYDDPDGPIGVPSVNRPIEAGGLTRKERSS